MSIFTDSNFSNYGLTAEGFMRGGGAYAIKCINEFCKTHRNPRRQIVGDFVDFALSRRNEDNWCFYKICGKVNDAYWLFYIEKQDVTDYFAGKSADELKRSKDFRAVINFCRFLTEKSADKTWSLYKDNK